MQELRSRARDAILDCVGCTLAGSREPLARALLAALPSFDTPSAQAPALLMYTSGTTGEPKGVMHSDNTLLANGRALVADWKHDSSTILLALSPMSHHIGTVAMEQSLVAGMELVLHNPAANRSALDWALETGATYVMGVPTHGMDMPSEHALLELVRSHTDLDDEDLGLAEGELGPREQPAGEDDGADLHLQPQRLREIARGERGLPGRALPSLKECLLANIEAAQVTQPEVVAVGIALNTSKLEPLTARRLCEQGEDELALPCADPVSMGVGKIVERLLQCF